MQEKMTAFEIFEAEREYFRTLTIGNTQDSNIVFYKLFREAEKQIKTWESSQKAALFCYLLAEGQFFRNSEHYSFYSNFFSGTIEHYWNLLLDKNTNFDESDIQSLFKAFIQFSLKNYSWYDSLLISALKKIEKDAKKSSSKPFYESFLALKTAIIDGKFSYYGKDKTRVINLIDSICLKVFEKENDDKTIIVNHFDEKDRLSEFANDFIANLEENEKRIWYKLIRIAKTANGSKPTQIFINSYQSILQEIDSERFMNTLEKLLQFFIDTKPIITQHQHVYGNGSVYNYTSHEFFANSNVDILKGLLWISEPLISAKYLQLLGKLLDKTQEKIPGKGPCALGLGNTCLYLFSQANNLEGIAQLSRAKLRVKQSNTVALIEKYLNEAAEKQGITISELEDLAVDDFGLIDASTSFSFGEYSLTIQLQSIGKVEQIWKKNDGSVLKAVPASVKKDFAVELKSIKEQVKQIETTSTSQRDRIDRMFRTERKMTWAHFEQYYLQHGLMSFLAKKIIWNFEENDIKITAFYIDNQWINERGEVVVLPKNPSVSLWHPVFATLETVSAWRNFLMEKEILQPLKQAFREVYILTEAERRTETYSNRMAAHVLKQHQFNSLAKLRGWKNRLLVGFDGHDAGKATLEMLDYQFSAEFWIESVDSDTEFNESGVFSYISTDQVRFSNNHGVIPLSEIPLLPFSEAMRDVDMFVGVASIGNDPNWTDNGGLPRYNTYWQSYSFGELTENAKTRAEVLKNLVPRLKIAPLCSFESNFLIVKGKIRSYKIHLGSGNILMTPNDQYLCIVPDGSKKVTDNKVFLPFEGDSILSIILSKAFLLAEDDKIKDVTITRQIQRN